MESFFTICCGKIVSKTQISLSMTISSLVVVNWAVTSVNNIVPVFLSERKIVQFSPGPAFPSPPASLIALSSIFRINPDTIISRSEFQLLPEISLTSKLNRAVYSSGQLELTSIINGLSEVTISPLAIDPILIESLRIVKYSSSTDKIP